MHELASKVPTAGPVHKQLQPCFRLVPAVLVFFIAVAVSETNAQAGGALPSAWTAADIGSPVVRGSATDAPCSASTGCPAFSVSGAGIGIGGTADQFMFLYQKLTGDGAVTIRLLGLAGSSTVEAGLMMRESSAASARHASILMGGSGVTVRSRLVTGGNTVSNPAARGTWLRLERVGPAIKALVSIDGSQWTTVATQTLALASTAYVGIVVTSRAPTSLATATVSNMAVSSTTPTLPSGWTSADVGSAVQPGIASYSNGSFIGASSGVGFTGAADGFRFVYTRVRGDAKLSTRLVASQGAIGRQAGIVLRTTLDAGAVETALVADDAGLVLVTRTAAGQTAAKTRVATTIAPVTLKLDRSGSMVTASYSIDGTTWKTVASSSNSLGTEVYAGLAVAGGSSGSLAAAAFDRLSLVSVPANAPPVVSLLTPTSGQLVLQGNAIAMAATATDPDDLVARVDFRVNGAVVASDTAAPYSALWTASAAGVYSIVATASDFDGAVTTSTAAVVTVTSSSSADPIPTAPSTSGSGSSPVPSGPWRLIFDASSDHATVTYYVLDVYNSSTRALVVTRNIGKPARASDGTCTVDVDTLVSAIPQGLYDGVVRAVSPTGTSASFAYTFSR
jgi:regulation of enolase protein 1 (concanavalin A-like superfamily)